MCVVHSICGTVVVDACGCWFSCWCWWRQRPSSSSPSRSSVISVNINDTGIPVVSPRHLTTRMGSCCSTLRGRHVGVQGFGIWKRIYRSRASRLQAAVLEKMSGNNTPMIGKAAADNLRGSLFEDLVCSQGFCDAGELEILIGP